MGTVIVYEKPSGGRLFPLMQDCLSALGSVFSMDGCCISGNPTADFSLLGIKNAREIAPSQGILLFERGFRPTGNCHIEHVTPIISFDHCQAASFLNGSTLPAITVGASGKATLSIASFGRDQADISLQRQVKTLTGETVEPCDFLVKHSGTLSLDDILLLSAVLLILGIPAGYDLSRLMIR